MLPEANRLRRSADFTLVIRHGRRAGAGAVVVHCLLATDHASTVGASTLSKVGFVVSGGVGGAVVRNTVRRRLRHLVQGTLAADAAAPSAGLMQRIPPGSMVVVRAQPTAATCRTAQLRIDLDHALDRAGRRRQ